MLQQLARDFAEDEIKPNAGKWDSNSEFPKDAIKKASDSGLLTLKIPEKYGGLGVGLLHAVAISQALGNGVGPIPFSGSYVMAPLAINLGGSEKQKEELIPKIVSN